MIQADGSGKLMKTFAQEPPAAFTYPIGDNSVEARF